MKMISLAAIILLNSLFVIAQGNRDNRGKAPAEVQRAWQRDHSNEGSPIWQQSNGQWHARYQNKANNRNVDTYYDRTGRQIDSHRQWNKNDMPSEYNQNIENRYHPNGNYDVTRIDRPNQKAVFELRINDRRTKKTVYTDERGNEIRYREPHRHG